MAREQGTDQGVDAYGQGCVHGFGNFVLDEAEKQLRCDGKPIAVNPRYFDALVLLVRNAGMLVSKDRFFDEVWRGMTVGDEALTQCIKSLRKALGDERRDPQYIATVPKYGYRFIAAVEPVVAAGTGRAPASRPVAQAPWLAPMRLAAAGTLGGGLAGAIGGVTYGLAAVGGGGSAASVLVVLTAITLAIGIIGAAGVSLGMAAASLVLRREWTFSIIGAAAGGLLIGAAFHILGTDSLHLLFGRAPQNFTGGPEGAVLGAALAAGARIGGGLRPVGWRPAIAAGVACGAAGILIALAGGKLLGGSLSSLAASFDQSGLRLDSLGRLSGEGMFGPVAQTAAAGIEGFLFGLGVVGAILWWRRFQAEGRIAGGTVPAG